MVMLLTAFDDVLRVTVAVAPDHVAVVRVMLLVGLVLALTSKTSVPDWLDVWVLLPCYYYDREEKSEVEMCCW